MMNIEEIRDYCISFPCATECLPFGDAWLVFKVEGKMFALLVLQPGKLGLLLKCDPNRMAELRERHCAVQPGYHMNKRYWNLIDLSFEIKNSDLKEWIAHSFEQVVAKLPAYKRTEILK